MGISGLTQVTTGAAALGNLLLVTPNSTVGYQPQNADGSFSQPALLFNYEGENTVTLESDITDHWVENNSSIQDQIALKPIIITTQGFIGELNNVPPDVVFQAFQVLQAAANKLTGVSAYTPGLSTTALLAYNEAVFAYTSALSLANSAISAYSSISGLLPAGAGNGGESFIIGNNLTKEPAQTQQQQYFQLFFGYYTERTLFTVQTPWAVFENMAIKSLKAIQSADTRMITDFEVSFKQINYASVTTEALLYSNNEDFQSILSQQASPTTNLGSFAVTGAQTSFVTGVNTLQ